MFKFQVAYLHLLLDWHLVAFLLLVLIRHLQTQGMFGLCWVSPGVEILIFKVRIRNVSTLELQSN